MLDPQGIDISMRNAGIRIEELYNLSPKRNGALGTGGEAG